MTGKTASTKSQNVTKEAILSGRMSQAQVPSTSVLIEELQRQRQSSGKIIDAKNKLIADMTKQIGTIKAAQEQNAAS